MRKLALLGLALALLAGCTSQEAKQKDLALACQLKPCICTEPKRIFLAEGDPQPVLWKQNGDAYCPEGLQLKMVDK